MASVLLNVFIGRGEGKERRMEGKGERELQGKERQEGERRGHGKVIIPSHGITLTVTVECML